MTIFDNDYLCHHGIKGQRWGIRRFQNEDGTKTDVGKQRYREKSHGTAFRKGGKKIENRRLSDMSDSELNERLNRMRKEQEYKKLTEPIIVKIGKAAFKAIIVTAAYEVAKNLTADMLRDGVKSVSSIFRSAAGTVDPEDLIAAIKR